MKIEKKIFQGTLSRFLIPLLLVIIAGVVLNVLITYRETTKLLYHLKEQESLTVLKKVIEIVSEYHHSVENYKHISIENRKRELSHLVEVALSIVKNFYDQSQIGKFSESEAQEIAKKVLSSIRYGENNYIFVIKDNYITLVHPSPKEIGSYVYNRRDFKGVYFIRKLVRSAKTAGEGKYVYVSYYWPKYKDGQSSIPEPKLSVATYFKPWGWIIGTGVYITDIKEEVNHEREKFLTRLCTRLNEMRLGKYGYAFIFDQKGNLIYHPHIKGNMIKAKMINHKNGRLLFDEFREAAQRPWGKNVVEYIWDHPEDPGHFVYSKVAWCAQEPLTGWYVGISAYKKEIIAPVFNVLLKGMIWIFLCTIAFLIIALYFLLKKLLAPINSMVLACKHIEKGNFSVQVPEDIPGEIGILAKQLNRMITAIRTFNHELEKKIQERTRELKEKTEELEKANERLKELDRSKSAFLSSVSHELRTPLTSVLGFAKLIHKDFTKFFMPLAKGNQKLEKKSKRIDENLLIILREGERLTRLINDVLDLAKIESGRIEWNNQWFSLKEVLEDAVNAVSGQIIEKPEVKLKMELSDDLPEIYADRDRVEQVIINLLNNAFKFTEKGYVKLKAWKIDNNKVRIVVEDTGCGIPKEDLKKVFDKFHQVVQGDTLKDKPKGTGLGLAICKEIVEHYGGRIWVESEVGIGSSFFIELPVVKKVKEKKEKEDELEKIEGKYRNKPLILVVDDEEGIRELLKQILMNAEYEVITAENGKEGVKKAQKYKPDLIIMDLMMPVMDGKTAIKHLREDPELSKVPIIVISILAERKDVEGDAFFEKPIDEEHLLEIVHSFLKSKELCKRPCLVVGEGERKVLENIVVLCPHDVKYCRKEELKEKIRSGFKGTVIIPHQFYQEIDFKYLSNYKNIQVVIV